MPKVVYSSETEKQKKIIGVVAIVLILVVIILGTVIDLYTSLPFPFIARLLLAFVIFAVANLLIRRVGKTSVVKT
ncbi:MAG: hypothetical protein FWH37_04585 [Candidatus Bathyarchaeota archaeon]|nr:hypothetical protein [Candidatus Termiticorpusculum sp.]